MIEPSLAADSNILWFSGYETYDGVDDNTWRPAWGMQFFDNPARQTLTGSNALFGNYSARVDYPLGVFSDGVQYKCGFADWPAPVIAQEEAYTRYYVRFDDDFDFRLGGKLPGLAGGAGNTGGSKPTGYDGWSARIMWRGNGKIVQYMYHIDQPTAFGEDFDWNLNCQKYFTPGKWHCVETYVKMNTVTGGVGDYNGVVRSWFDGNLALERTNVRYRHTEALKIDLFYFSTFFGGGDITWAPLKDEQAQFDNFIVSKTYIGPCADCVIPDPPTPVPTAGSVIVTSENVFDSDNAGWTAGGWNGTYNFNDASKNHTLGGSESGNAIFPAGSWGTAYFDKGADFNLTNYTHVDMWVYPGDCNSEFRVAFRNSGGTQIGTYVVISGFSAYMPGEWKTGQWNYISIPLSAFAISAADKLLARRLMLQANAITDTDTFNVDDVKIIRYGAVFTPTVTPTNTSAFVPSKTITQTVTRTVTYTATKTVTGTATQTLTQTQTQSSTPSVTNTITHTVTKTITDVPTPTVTSTDTREGTATHTATVTQTHTDTQTATQTFTSTLTLTVTQTLTPTVTFTVSQTYTDTPTVTQTATDTQTSTVTQTATESPQVSATPTQTATDTASVTETITQTAVVSMTDTQTITQTQTTTAVQSATDTPTLQQSPTQTFTQTIQAQSPTSTQTNTPQESPTETITQTFTPAVTQTDTPTQQVNTVTPTMTKTATETATKTATATATKTNTATITQTTNLPATFTPTPTLTPAVTAAAYDDGRGPKDLYIFPNPAKDRITILYDLEDGMEEGEISVYTAAYRLVQRFAVKKESSRIISGGVQYYVRVGISADMANGVYFVCLRAGEKKVIKKFIILK